ncbi:MAG: hypothetical protein QM733_14375 [Ilumatobacteraceae bacterium]
MRRLGFSATYLLISFVVLLPVLVSPVIADDFVNPFSQMAHSGTGLFDSLEYGWRGATSGGSFRIVGNLVGVAYNWTWIQIAAHLDIGIGALYAATKYVVLLGAALAVARFAFVVARTFLRPVGFRDCLVLVSIPLFGSLQIHAPWSNDPVANYPLAGFGSVILGFLALSEAVTAIERPSWRRWVVATVIATVAVLYYEMTFGAVLGGCLIIAAGAWTAIRDRRDWRVLLSGVWYTAVPLALLAYGRTVTGKNASSYDGTTARLAGTAGTMKRLLAGALPGASWRRSAVAMGGNVPMVFRMLPVAVVVVVVVALWARTARRRLQGGWRFTRRSELVAACVAPVVYLLFATGLQAVTVKVQNETLAVGYVYMWYAVGACVVALAGAVIATWALAAARSNLVRLCVMTIFGIFLFAQMTINWRLNDFTRVVYARNMPLLEQFDDGAPEAARCAALTNWASLTWPDYYESDMINGLQAAYQADFGEPFCDGFVRPPT